MFSTASAALALPKSQDTDCALIKHCPVIKPRCWIKCIIINPFKVIIDDKKKEGRPHQCNDSSHKKREQVSMITEVVTVSNSTKL